MTPWGLSAGTGSPGGPVPAPIAPFLFFHVSLLYGNITYSPANMHMLYLGLYTKKLLNSTYLIFLFFYVLFFGVW